MIRYIVFLFLFNFCISQEVKTNIDEDLFKKEIWADLLLINDNYNKDILGLDYKISDRKIGLIIEEITTYDFSFNYTFYKVKVRFNIIFNDPYLFKDSFFYTFIKKNDKNELFKFDGFLISQVKNWFLQYLTTNGLNKKQFYREFFQLGIYSKKETKEITNILFNNKESKTGLFKSVILSKYFKVKYARSFLIPSSRILR